MLILCPYQVRNRTGSRVRIPHRNAAVLRSGLSRIRTKEKTGVLIQSLEEIPGRRKIRDEAKSEYIYTMSYKQRLFEFWSTV